MIAAAHLWMLPLALLLDAVVGDPDLFWKRVPHPVVLLGRLVSVLDNGLNRKGASPAMLRLAGLLALAVIVIVAAAVGLAIELAFRLIPHGWIGTVVVAAVFLAGRSLYDHVAAVAKAFAEGGLDGARKAVARIVGRDPASLDKSGVSRAAIESLAENFSDGLVAPAFWFAVLGLPGLLAYKAVNTADSMIGHRTARHEHFGWASARFDDLVNLPASRLSGTLIALAAPLAGGSIGHSFDVMRREAKKHRSPNAGWPEAAMAAALGLAIAGPRRYRGVLVDDPFLNPGGRKRATPADIRRALKVYLGAWALLIALAAVLAAVASGIERAA